MLFHLFYYFPPRRLCFGRVVSVCVSGITNKGLWWNSLGNNYILVLLQTLFRWWRHLKPSGCFHRRARLSCDRQVCVCVWMREREWDHCSCRCVLMSTSSVQAVSVKLTSLNVSQTFIIPKSSSVDQCVWSTLDDWLTLARFPRLKKPYWNVWADTCRLSRGKLRRRRKNRC